MKSWYFSPLPGHHDQSHIAVALRDLAKDWCIRIDDRVSAFTSDNASNIVKTLKEDLHKTHVPCAGHTLNLSVQAALSVRSILTPLALFRKVTFG